MKRRRAVIYPQIVNYPINLACMSVSQTNVSLCAALLVVPFGNHQLAARGERVVQ